ncbi:HicA family toxin-antitoxin system [Oceanobacillus profundus]|uniref:HicA family toxin-antitoxin system n=1 Tax=Oceanobacillus profundus TaxID=372463 RepID=A0A417YKK3_9BACI|nr:HicA family toxin-antitoxin system [Oceanobacillus profundus]MBR3119423.1 HicA family toxin-antitoxin system [Oceanobacillus sp.]PAE29989.1 HicA family toxin-antitoxin system [Paenibacillus sp. 7884-2]MCM3396309.1 HicA family toxin-antitoxin system [Oceanobacillus profundus]MDO6449681.1 HicA family toxin-antitoxin system [Oceanobacillus profundus]RHW33683.1 HicA family toxin-antitoxin system [Oceanobacillus profundus]
MALVDNFEVEQIFEDRTYERHQFKLKVHGNQYVGNFHDGEIQWLNPHPQQDLGDAYLKAVELEVHRLLDEHGVKDETDDIEVKPLFADQTHDVHQFKLSIQGNEYKGIFRDDEIRWFHPKPERHLKDERVEKVEVMVQEKIQKHIEESRDDAK